MKRFVVVVILVVFAGCHHAKPYKPPLDPARPNPFVDNPPVMLPTALRTDNYGRGGSCLHAATADALTGAGQRQLARWWTQNHIGGANAWNLMPELDRAGIPYVATFKGEESVLEWCSRTRRPAVIHWQGGAHAITFCGYAGGQACLIDNNNTSRVRRMPKAEFLNEWKDADGGVALAIIGTPLPPRPW
jgi:hypothetical protein